MKNLKKLASVALALVMTMALMVPAFADEPTYSITIDNSVSGHKYEAYQIFTGTLSEDGQTLSDVVWGSGVDYAADATVVYPEGSTAKTAAEIAASLENQADAAAFADFIATHLASIAGSADTQTGGVYVISNLARGYYLVKDQDNSQQGNNDAYTDFIMKVVADVTVTPKQNDTPVLEKTSGTANKVDASVGDVIPFTLKATLPSAVTEYVNGYKLIFTDTLTGLDLDQSSIKISVGGNQITSDISSYISVSGNVLTVTINDVTAAPFNAGNDAVITVDYNATLNSDAIATDDAGNKVGLEFSNNPNGDGTGKTETEVEVDVYSYEIVIDKYNGADETKATKLENVGFKLYRNGTAGKEYAVINTDGVITEWNATGTEVFTDADGALLIDGLGNGTYYLEETSPLDGFNKIDDVVVVINGKANNGSLSATVGGESAAVDETAESVTAQIENNQGALLPSTGGMGTTIFYVVGGVLLVGSAILFVTKKRMGE